MAAAAEPLLMTVEQYRRLPERDDIVQELRWGQVVTLTQPKMKHTKLQYRLVELLRPETAGKGVVAAEIPFRALPEYELRRADVAYVSQKRWDETPGDDNLRGSPELVIEILSPSNTKTQIREKAVLCLSTGAEEFWVIDPADQTIAVTRQHGETNLYRVGDRVPIALLETAIEVSQIFG